MTKKKTSQVWKEINKHKWRYLFVAPWVLLYGVFGIYPLLLSFYLTFFNWALC